MCKAETPPKRVFVVGGFDSMVFGNFQRNLNENGIEIGGHYHKGDVLRAIPIDCDGVVIMYDMVSHTIINQAVEMAAARSLPLVRVPRKWSVAIEHFRKQGFLPDTPGEVSVAGDPTPPALPEPLIPKPTEKVLTWIENDPRLATMPDDLVEALMAGDPTLDNAVAAQAVVDALSSFRKSLDDRTRTGSERKRALVKTWLVRWFHRATAGEDDLPTFDSFRKRGKETFGVSLNYDFVLDARLSAYGAWAQEMTPAARLSGWFDRLVPDAGRPLAEFLEAGEIEGVKTREGWMTSKTAIEKWRVARLTRPTPVPAAEPERTPLAEPAPVPTFDVETFKADLVRAVKDAVKEITAPLEEQILLLELQVEALQNRIENGCLRARTQTPGQQGG